MIETCDENFIIVLFAFMTEAGYDFCEVANIYGTISQMNSDTLYNLQKIINGIKLNFISDNWKNAFDIILEKGFVVKCYEDHGDTAIFLGGTNATINKFGN